MLWIKIIGLCFLLNSTVSAQILPQWQYDGPRTVVSMPVTLISNNGMYFSMARQVLAVCGDKPVDILLSSYVKEGASIEEMAGMQFATQRLQRYIHEKMPAARISFSQVSTVPYAVSLPAWRISHAKVRPYGYIVVTLSPLALSEGPIL